MTAPPATTAPATGQTIGTWSGTRNENTPGFQILASGDYVVSWSYWGNNDQYGPSNFAIVNTNSSAPAMSLPNDIAASGHGSCEVTGGSGTERFSVQATGSWTIKVVSAP